MQANPHCLGDRKDRKALYMQVALGFIKELTCSLMVLMSSLRSVIERVNCFIKASMLLRGLLRL